MSRPNLHVPSFGAGIVREGSADLQRTDEVLELDGYDIGARGVLQPSEDAESYVTVNDTQTVPVALKELFALFVATWAGEQQLVVAGEGRTGAGPSTPLFFLARANPRTELVGTPIAPSAVAGGTPGGEGAVVTFAQLGYVSAGGEQLRPLFVNFGPRVGSFQNTVPGLYVVTYTPSTATYAIAAISTFSKALGDGTSSKQLKFRGIVQFNSYLFGYGYDASAANLDGPNRVMFTNLGDPFKWGNDPGGAANRVFADTDAIIIGGAHETILAALVWKNRLWFATDRGLHWIAGSGRDSFTTDGYNSETDGYGVVSPHCLLEGPDGRMYGLGPEGLWRFDGQFDPIGDKLRDRDGRSIGFWDLLWRDPDTFVADIPGRTNLDLCWMYSDERRGIIGVVIPFCDSENGFGLGDDTVVIKFNVKTGGFSRQVFTGFSLSHGAIVRRGTGERQETFVLTPDNKRVAVSGAGVTTTPTDGTNVRRIGHRANATDILPSAVSDLSHGTGLSGYVKFGPYAPFGADGVGVMQRVYLTISFDVSELPLMFDIAAAVDGEALQATRLHIGAVAPGTIIVGKYNLWLDTSGTDAVLGVATAGAIVAAAADYRLKEFRTTGWFLVPGAGQKEGRVCVPISFKPKRGTRLTVTVSPTNICGRHQIEGLGMSPSIVRGSQ